MGLTKIEWCKNADGTKGHVWNVIGGCPRGCPYCYAKKLHDRFNKTPFETLHFYDERLKYPAKIKKPSMFFVNSMSDIEYYPKAYIEYIIEIIAQCRQHKFVFLTKDLECKVYRQYKFPENCYLGLTLTGKKNRISLDWHNPILNCEPLHYNMIIEYYGRPVQTIIGFETGKKNIKKPDKSYLENFINSYHCGDDSKLFIKDNVYKHYPDLPRTQERI